MIQNKFPSKLLVFRKTQKCATFNIYCKKRPKGLPPLNRYKSILYESEEFQMRLLALVTHTRSKHKFYGVIPTTNRIQFCLLLINDVLNLRLHQAAFNYFM
jgi:hypothetical protein